MTTIALVDFESAGPDGTVLTLPNTGANTIVGAGANAPVSNAAGAFVGSFAMRTKGGGTANSGLFKNLTGAPLTVAYAQYYFTMPAVVGAIFLALSLNDAAGNVGASARINTDLTLQLRDGAASRGFTAVAPLPGDPCRLNLKSTPGNAGSAACRLEIFFGANVDGTTPDGFVEGVNTSTLATNLTNVRAGNITAGPDMTIDRVIVDDTAFPAPRATTGPPMVGVGAPLTHDAGGSTFNVSMTATPATGRAIASRSWTQVGTGPAVVIDNPLTATATIHPPATAGTVTLRASATDNGTPPLTGSADLVITFVTPGDTWRLVTDFLATGWTAVPTASPLASNIDDIGAYDLTNWIESPDGGGGVEYKGKAEVKAGPASATGLYIELELDVTPDVTVQSTTITMYDADGTTVRVPANVITDLIPGTPTLRQFPITALQLAAFTAWASGVVVGIKGTYS